MRLDPNPMVRSTPSLLPMIDVVFFLIIFFMMVSQFAAPEPFAVARPASTGTEAVEGQVAVFIQGDGTIATLSDAGAVVTGEAALPVLAAARVAQCGAGCPEPPVLLVHADAEAPAAAVARLLPALARLGFADVRLVTVRE